jgi:AcrR family transcriptional regulator
MDSTRELLESGGLQRANIQTIARHAGVTRPTVYQQFSSLSELLLAVMNETLDRADVQAVRKALQHRDAAKGVRGMLRGSTRFWDSEATLFNRIKGLAIIDPGVSEIDKQKEKVRRGHIENITGRLANDGQLRAGVSRGAAAERLYLLSSFESYERLRALGYSTDAITQRLIDVAEQTVIVSTA